MWNRKLLGAALILASVTIAIFFAVSQWERGTTTRRHDRDQPVMKDDGRGRVDRHPDVEIDAPLKSKFDSLKEGMTLAKVEEVLGPASGSYSSDTRYEYYIWKGNDGWCRVWVRQGQVHKLGFDNPR
jgi:hypothetical protein